MKKILILIPNLNQPGGVAGIYNNLNLIREQSISYFPINKSTRQSSFAAIFRLMIRYCVFTFKVIGGNYKVIHINPSLTRRSFYRDLVFIIMAHILRRKTLVFFHGWREDFEKKIKKSSLKSFLFRISYARVDKYIVLSPIFKKKLNQLGVPHKTIFYIGTSVADSSFIHELDLKRKFNSYTANINFLFLSRIEKEKGIYIAIDAYNMFLNKHREIKSSLIIAGDGSEFFSAKRYAQDMNIKSIEFLGNVIGDNKKNVLLNSHIMLFPSYTEGLPNCILEGMLYGMPVISRITGGIPDVIQQGVNGYLSDSLQPEVFAEYLFILASNKELYKKMADENHRIALEKYTTEKARERMIEIYRGFN